MKGQRFLSLWGLALLSLLLGAVTQLVLQPELKDGAMSFEPDINRVGELVTQGPGRLLGHSPALFLVNAALISAFFGVLFMRGADE